MQSFVRTVIRVRPAGDFGPAQRVVAILVILFAGTLSAPLGVALLFHDGVWPAFAETLGLMAGIGALLWWPARRSRRELRSRDGFLVVALTWTFLSLLGALPLYLDTRLGLSYSQSVFETVSGLTTTGSTVMVGLDQAPRSVLFYRSLLQWFGGMGIILLALAILPMLGVGGMQLYRAETPGPVKDKLTPRLASTAKALWIVYVGATALCAGALWVAGMSPFDAVCHSFATLSTGGFSTHDASIGFFASPAIEWITIVFMVIGAANFALHYRFLKTAHPSAYWLDAEFRTYLGVLIAAAAGVSLYLYFGKSYPSLAVALTKGTFQAVTFGTTSGFGSADFTAWPWAVQGLLIFLTFFVSCAGSTGGGLKMVRFYLIIKEYLRELTMLIHPHAEIPGEARSDPRRAPGERSRVGIRGDVRARVRHAAARSHGRRARPLDGLLEPGRDDKRRGSRSRQFRSEFQHGRRACVVDLQPRHAARPARAVHSARDSQPRVLASLASGT